MQYLPTLCRTTLLKSETNLKAKYDNAQIKKHYGERLCIL